MMDMSLWMLYLWDNFNYTFETLKQNIKPAMKSVELSTIWKWEHWMVQWLDAYREGKGTKEALMKMKQGSSKQYTSHQRVLKSATAAVATGLPNLSAHVTDLDQT